MIELEPENKLYLTFTQWIKFFDGQYRGLIKKVNVSDSKISGRVIRIQYTKKFEYIVFYVKE